MVDWLHPGRGATQSCLTSTVVHIYSRAQPQACSAAACSATVCTVTLKWSTSLCRRDVVDWLRRGSCVPELSRASLCGAAHGTVCVRHLGPNEGLVRVQVLGVKALFPGKDSLHQLRLIVERLGAPSDDELAGVENEQARWGE